MTDECINFRLEETGCCENAFARVGGDAEREGLSEGEGARLAECEWFPEYEKKVLRDNRGRERENGNLANWAGGDGVVDVEEEEEVPFVGALLAVTSSVSAAANAV